MQLLIYTSLINARKQYIFDFIFKNILNVDFRITNDVLEFKKYKGAKFSYSEKALGNELFFKSEGLLSQNDIQILEIETSDFGADRVPFAVNEGILPFDPFSASFYIITRYEEYLTFKPDQHLRYPPEESLQYQLNILDRPIIDEWAILIKNLIKARFKDLEFGKRTFSFHPTIDIDRAFHFKSSGIIKNTARFFKAFFSNDKERISNLLNTGLGKQKDPFDTYHFFEKLHNKYKLKPIFFFLLSNNGDRNFDVNINPYDKLLQNLIIETHKIAEVGIHPSYASNSNWLTLKDEKELLEKIIKTKVSQSRQHFLRLHLPKTYLQLQKVEIFADYSMGYASQVGFRAGTCTPFYWYDLQLEKQSQLKVYPFVAMDATFRRYLKATPDQAISILKELIAKVKLVDGTFYCLWHNESLSEAAEWRGWRIVYEQMLKEACE